MIKTDSQFEVWHGCYEEGWRDYILPDAFVHPAKFAKNLVDRILRDGLEHGYFKPGDVIGDPFGGVGTGGILAAYAGLRWVGVELEEKFYTLAKANFEKHRRTLEGFNDPLPVILSGDSRRFAELVAPVAAVVTSPPFGIDQPCASQTRAKKDYHAFTRGNGTKRSADLSSAGNIAALPVTGLDAVLTSPPYAESLTQGNKQEGYDYTRYGGGGQLAGGQRYGNAEGQIGSLKSGSIDAVVTSPPYADAGQGGGADSRPERCEGSGKSISLRDGYGESDGQIGTLRPGNLDAVVTSPPYEGTAVEKNSPGIDIEKQWATYRASGGGMGLEKFRAQQARHSEGYGNSEGQIGAEAGETYWTAMKAVYGQCLLALKPGGVLYVVLKDYVKNGERVPLCDQSARLLEAIGFRVERRIRAMLVKEQRTPALFGGEHVVKTERKSFFRRLHEAKGSPRIDWEEVLVCFRPGEE